MTLEVELNKHGKPHIVFEGQKFRESYKTKSGVVTWRCLGATCAATVKTDSERTTVISSNTKHSGRHPSTMRALMSPQSSRPSTPATAAETDTPRVEASVAGFSQPPSSGRSTASPFPHSADELIPAMPHAASTPTVAQLSAENTNLRGRLSLLDNQYRCVLDHSIESDMRLMRFTDQVFLSGSLEVEPVTPATPVAVVDCAVQCDPPSGECTNRHCILTRDLVASLRTTVEVLEAEVLSLKNELSSVRSSVEEQSEGSGWVLCRKGNSGTTVSNKYQLLSSHNDQYKTKKLEENTITKKANNKSKRKPRKQRPSLSNIPRAAVKVGVPEKPLSPRSTQLPFKTVLIEGDSHARHLADLLQMRIAQNTRVTGICKPGAGLLSVTSGAPPPPEACSILIAGTNDIAAGESQTIYRDLERRITARLGSAQVIVANLPHRHDLPHDHPVNQQTALANGFIEELCRRLNVEVIDFNCIQRRWFTRHGMHLRLPGKRLLVELMLRRLVGVSLLRPEHVDAVASPEPLSPPATALASRTVWPPSSTRETTRPSMGTTDRPKTPRSLPHNTFADAVKANQKNALALPVDEIS